MVFEIRINGFNDVINDFHGHLLTRIPEYIAAMTSVVLLLLWSRPSFSTLFLELAYFPFWIL